MSDVTRLWGSILFQRASVHSNPRAPWLRLSAVASMYIAVHIPKNLSLARMAKSAEKASLLITLEHYLEGIEKTGYNYI